VKITRWLSQLLGLGATRGSDAPVQPALRRVHRRRHGRVGLLELDLEVASAGYRRLAGAVAWAVGVVCHEVGSTVGCVSIVGGEEPVFVSLAARRDVIAPRVAAILGAGESHRRPELFLVLERGVFLAQVIDPCRQVDATDEALARLVAGGLVRAALLLQVIPGARVAGVQLRVLAPFHELRASLRLARHETAEWLGRVAR
jgi:hypothetical protein